MRIVTPAGRLPWWAVVAANATFWPTWTFGVGYVAHRLPDERFTSDNELSRTRQWERGGRWYRDTVRIDAWKDRLPEAGAFYGGYAKRSVASTDDADLARFIAETRRAELAHWAMLGGAIVTPLWNPWWAFPVNAVVGVGSNLPCIAVQRYNRARLQRVRARRSRSFFTSGR